MSTKLDEGKGLIKVSWSDVREKVAKVEPLFCSIVDEIGVDDKLPLYLAYYSYGALKGDTQSTFLPDGKGGYYRLSDPNAPKDVIKNLSYGKSSAPLAMLLEKNLELYLDLKNSGFIIPRIIYTPGAIFPFARILSQKSNRTYAPNGVLTLTSGARSVFMLPNIGCATHYSNLQRDFNIKSSPPKSLHEHWFVFKEIINSKMVNSNWRSCLMYFSKSWLDKIYTDKAWVNLKLYLHELAWKHYEYQRNRFYYDVAFSMIQKKRNLKPNPYLADTAQHLFTIALGAAPGYMPALNDDALPVEILQDVFIKSYGLKKYYPTILQPTHFNFEEDKYPIYYSLQHPSTHVFSPKSRKISSTLAEVRELEHLIKIFSTELAGDSGLCPDTIVSEIASEMECNFFHNKVDRHNVIQPSSNILNHDKRFEQKPSKHEETRFASDAPFVRGCVSISRKH